MNVRKPENSSYETRNFSSNISSNMQKKCWMKCWTGLLRSYLFIKTSFSHYLQSYLQLRRWYRKLCLFYKVFKNEHPKHLFYLIHVRSTPYPTRTVGNIPLIKTKHNFKNSFFPSAIIEWNNLDSNL